MAKLNGVNVVSEKITYNGAEYIKTDASAKVGDIIRIGEECASYVKDGAFYEISDVDSDGDTSFVDEDGDDFYVCNLDETPDVFAKVYAQSAPADANTVVHNGVTYRKVARKAKEGDKFVIANVNEADLRKGVVYAIDNVDSSGEVNVIDDAEDEHYLCDNEFTVLEPLAAASDAKLPSDYVIHEGAVYRKELRKAKVGEKVIRTAPGGHDYVQGGVYEVSSVDSNGSIKRGGAYANLWQTNYAVLVPTDTVTIGGAVYTLAKRKANVGESVVVVSHVGNDKYAYGEILTVKNHQERCDGKPAYSVGKMYIAMESDCLVLVPKASVKTTPNYREVKRKANVGERIRIVDAHAVETRYKNGDEGVVTRMWGEPDVRATINGEDCGVVYGEYVVLEPVATAKPAPANRLKVGDYAKVVQSGHSRYGQIVKVTQNDRVSPCGYIYATESLVDGTSTDIYALDGLVRATDEEVAAAKRKNVKVGDYVRITGNKAPNDGGPHHYEIGDIVEVRHVYSDSVSCVRESDNRIQTVSALNYEPVTVAEAEAARKQAEEVAAKWAKIGRKVGEIRKGDVVKTLRNVGGHPVGTIGISDGCGCVTANGDTWAHSSVELIAPVESLFSAN